MLRVVTGCAVLLGLTATAVASPQIDCTVQQMHGAERALLSIDNEVFEIVADVELALAEGVLTPEAFCAIQDDDFVAFILPVPRLPDESMVAPLPGIDGGMIEPWAPDPWGQQRGTADKPEARLAEPDRDAPTALVERTQSLAWSPGGADEPAPSPSHERHPVALTGGCDLGANESTPAWWGVLALLALARRRRAR